MNQLKRSYFFLVSNCLFLFLFFSCQTSNQLNSKIKTQKPLVLVTGGTGFIGSHVLVELMEASYEVVVLDNLLNSSKKSLSRVEAITGKKIVEFFEKDLTKLDDVQMVFDKYKFDAVIHLAALKAVGESVQKPVKYYSNNLIGTLNLLKVMKKTKTKNLVFSSSCTIYGMPKSLPITEDYQRKYGFNAMNPYGESKSIVEKMLMDIAKSSNQWNFVSLRYFNPIGAHQSGLIGEDPKGIPNNLNPYILKVINKELPGLTIFGDDYETPDGTCIRDYIHVMDLASSHIKAMELLLNKENSGYRAYNIGTNKGYSVKEIVSAYERILGEKIDYKIGKRRSGDAPAIYADASLAQKELNWKAKRNLDDMVRDSLNWVQKNPNGYL